MTESETFIHISGNRYYKFKPKFPYVFVSEYLQTIPKPSYNEVESMDWVDWLEAKLTIYHFYFIYSITIVKVCYFLLSIYCVSLNIYSISIARDIIFINPLLNKGR